MDLKTTVPVALGQRLAVLSMDVEDWYHLDYLTGLSLPTSPSLLDGLDVYSELLEEFSVPSTFFVVAEIAGQVAGRLRALQATGHDISCHGLTHRRPLTLAPDTFARQVREAHTQLQDLIGGPVPGFRAPCFSLDRTRLEAVRASGFSYDCSKIACAHHPLYGNLDVSNFTRISPSIYVDGDFAEFEVSTLPLAGRRLPVSGGGYLRMFPWPVMRSLLTRYLRDADLYTLYIHPFELSSAPSPLARFPVPWKQALRFQLGRSSVPRKLRALIMLLRDRGFKFTTFAALQKTCVRKDAVSV